MNTTANESVISEISDLWERYEDYMAPKLKEGTDSIIEELKKAKTAPEINAIDDRIDKAINQCTKLSNAHAYTLEHLIVDIKQCLIFLIPVLWLPSIVAAIISDFYKHGPLLKENLDKSLYFRIAKTAKECLPRLKKAKAEATAKLAKARAQK